MVGSIPAVTVSFTLKRRATYYVVNVVIPSVLLSLLSVFVFLLPVSSGEKMSLQVRVQKQRVEPEVSNSIA